MLQRFIYVLHENQFDIENQLIIKRKKKQTFTVNGRFGY